MTDGGRALALDRFWECPVCVEKMTTSTGTVALRLPTNDQREMFGTTIGAFISQCTYSIRYSIRLDIGHLKHILKYTLMCKPVRRLGRRPTGESEKPTEAWLAGCLWLAVLLKAGMDWRSGISPTPCCPSRPFLPFPSALLVRDHA